MTTQELSKRVEKGQEAGRAYQAQYMCEIMRTADKVIVKRPSFQGQRFQTEFANYMKRVVGLSFNNEKGWWEAPLSQTRNIISAIAQDYDYLLSDGVQKWLSDTKPTQLWVTIEYRHKGYSKPMPIQTYDITTTVSRTDEPIAFTGYLADDREKLIELGYKMIEVKAVNYYERGQFNPLWAETWVRLDYSAEQTVK